MLPLPHLPQSTLPLPPLSASFSEVESIFSGRLGTFRCLPACNRSACIIHSWWVKSSSASPSPGPLISAIPFLPPLGRSYTTASVSPRARDAAPRVWVLLCTCRDSQMRTRTSQPTFACVCVYKSHVPSKSLNISPGCLPTTSPPAGLCAGTVRRPRAVPQPTVQGGCAQGRDGHRCSKLQRAPPRADRCARQESV